nr:hypothetical protein [Tanacetum cinerariifolium]
MRARRYFQKTGKKIKINGSDTAGYDKTKVECFNCHKMRHFEMECRSPRNQESRPRNQDSSRKTVIVEDTSSKAMVAIDGAGFDWSYMADDEVPTNMALMAFSNSEGASQDALKDQYFDNGCSRHMTGNISYLNGFKEHDEGYVSFGGGAKGGKITGKGIIKTTTKDETSRIIKSFITEIENLVEKKAEAVNTACFVQDRVLVVKQHFKTLYELFKGRSPALSLMRPFGCHVSILNTLDQSEKFDGKLDDRIFVGYSTTSKAFRVYNIRTNKVEENLHITFLENKPMITGGGPEWLFNLNVLSKSINYAPVFADTNSTNFAGKEASFDAASESDNQERPNAESNTTTINTGGPINTTPTYVESPNDPIMPNLEDARIFDDAYDDRDEGAEADYNNLETDILVSHIPSTRIHNDHPKEHIIGETLLDLPPGKRSIGTKWVYRNKRDQKGIVVKNKARLVSQGLRQEESIDYDKVFAPVARIEAISQPPGFVDPEFPDRVYKVEKALYGLHQAPRACVDSASTPMETHKPLSKDAAGTYVDVHLYRSMIGSLMYLTSSRPDIMFGSPLESIAYSDSDYASASLDRKSTTGGCQFLGLELKGYLINDDYDDLVQHADKKELAIPGQTKTSKELSNPLMPDISQPLGFVDPEFPDRVGEIDKTLSIKHIKNDIPLVQVYVDDIIFGSTKSVKSASTPIETHKPLSKDAAGTDVDAHLYSSMIGSLMYLTSSRPDIMFAVCACSRFQVQPKVSHMHTVKRIFRYLKGQPTLVLWYPKDSPLELIAYSNSDYAGPVLIENLQQEVTNIHVDNESAICVVKNHVYHSKTKHIEIRHHFIRDYYEKRLIEMVKIHNDYNVADLLTKAFDVTSFLLLVGLVDIVGYNFVLLVQKLVLLGLELKGYLINDGYVDLVQHADKKELAIPWQTATGKELSNPLMAESLPKTISAIVSTAIWNTASSKIINSVKQIHVIVDGKAIVISESSVRSDLLFDDEDGITCLTNDDIFKNLALMGYEPLSTKLTFQKDTGGSPRRQETMGGTSAQTRSERVLEQPYEPPLSEGHTSGSGEERMKNTVELTDIVPPTPYDSPLTGGYTPESDEETLLNIKRSTTKDKGKGIMQETKLPKKIKKRKMIQLSLDEELAQKLYAEELAKETARQKQKKYNLEKALELQRHLDKREKDVDKGNQAQKIDWNDPTGGYKKRYFKGVKYKDNKPIFERVWDQVHTFVPKDSEIKKEVMKRYEFHLQQESSKKQKLDQQTEEKEEEAKAQADSDQEVEKMKLYMRIVLDEDITIDTIPLATKPLVIVEYKIVKE